MGHVVADVGAHIGVTVKIFGRRAKTLHAFEPSPRALRLLRANAPANCVIYPCAIGDYNGKVRFAEADNVDMSHISESGIEVEIRTLDSFNLAPDFIKIDVEGWEPAVLRGAARTLQRGPTVMFEALTPDALQECKEVILKANNAYSFHALGGGTNFLARVGGA